MSTPDEKPANGHTEELLEFMTEFLRESDRAAVVLAAAKLDTQLYQVLQHALLPCSTGEDELLGPDRPLGTFSARISVSHRLGLIDARLARALHLIRKIRNDFAHELSAATLASGPNRNRVRDLIRPLQDQKLYRDMKRLVQEHRDQDTPNAVPDPAADFRAAVAFASAALDHLFMSCETFKAERAVSFGPRVRNEHTPSSGVGPSESIAGPREEK